MRLKIRDQVLHLPDFAHLRLDDPVRQAAHARIAELEQHLNPDSMAEALIVRLDERYAKKAGRKPSPSEAA